jgi:DoxX-like family
MKARIQKIAAWVIAGIAAAMVILSGLFKLSGSPAVVEGMTQMGVGPYISYLGIMEITFATLFIFPRTAKLGFLLLTCYFAGAMATDLSHGHTMANSMFVLILVWVAAFLRIPDVFITRTVKA